MADAHEKSKPEPNAARPRSGGRRPLPARGTIAGANVSWEERRKGLSPQSPEGPDETFYDERFTSERQQVDRAAPDWDLLEREGPAAGSPNWPPALRP